MELTVRAADRCGRPQLIRSVRVRSGETIAVPRRPHDLVVVKLTGAQESLVDRITALLYLGRARYVTVNGERYRYAPGSAVDGFLLTVPAEADYPAPFALSLDARSLSFSSRGTIATFYAVPID